MLAPLLSPAVSLSASLPLPHALCSKFVPSSYRKSNGFTSAVSKRKISQGLASRQFPKMRKQFGPSIFHFVHTQLAQEPQP